MATRLKDMIDQPSEDLIDLGDSEINASAANSEPAPAGGNRAVSRLTKRVFNMSFFVAGLLLSIVAVVWLLYVNTQRFERESRYIEQSSQLLMLSQRMAKDAREAVQGEPIAFKGLKESRDRFESIITVLRNGDAVLGLPETPADAKPALEAVVRIWAPKANEGVRAQVDQILGQQRSLALMRSHVAGINQISPRLLLAADDMLELGTRVGMKPEHLLIASRQTMLSQRIAKDVNRFAQGGSEAAVAAAQFGKDARLYRENEAKLRVVVPADLRSKLGEATGSFAEMQKYTDGILGAAAELFVAQRASEQVFEQSEPLLKSARDLVAAYEAWGSGTSLLVYTTIAIGFVALLFLVLFAYRQIADAKARERASADQNRQTQDAILKLLDEMGNLADGDLTIQPEVTEQITGAIADSINYAVREMRGLVYRIKNAATQMASESENSQQTATELTEAALRQAAQITETTERVKSMARSMSDMSRSAEKSAEVAHGSVTTARRGAQAVQDTIHGMDQMREQIQETAKRIKRLGESSQQVSEIVELINDIAEQTNILSLNAAIQAAMAGEAGRGFAVVADEVQRLAERSAEATKQIADLVKTIQADTNEAVASMEQATQGVVQTTRLADAAGQALGEIESVSQQLSSLIVSISRDAQKQSETATGVSGSMAKIQETTTMTSTGTRQTAEAIGKLSELARELQSSVAGFKLPA